MARGAAPDGEQVPRARGRWRGPPGNGALPDGAAPATGWPMGPPGNGAAPDGAARQRGRPANGAPDGAALGVAARPGEPGRSAAIGWGRGRDSFRPSGAAPPRAAR